jgi:hypothetical protein
MFHLSGRRTTSKATLRKSTGPKQAEVCQPAVESRPGKPTRSLLANFTRSSFEMIPPGTT